MVRAQEAHLCCLRGSLAFAHLLEVLVAECDVRHYAVVQELQRCVSGLPLVVAYLHDAAVTPPADALVGRQLVEVVDVTYKR